MNDFDYDVREKKRIANSARARKNGSKSKYCSLPSDHMTAVQWKKRNGEVMSYDLKKPLNWTQFTTMPVDIQAEYIRGLSEKYHVTIRCLADLFGVSWDTVSRYMKLKHSWFKVKRGVQMSPQDKAGFAEFLCGSDAYSPVVIEETPAQKLEIKTETPIPKEDASVPRELEQPVEPKEKPVKGTASRFKMRKLVTEFEDTYDADAIQNMIRAILPTGLTGLPVSVKIEIDVLDS